MSKTLIFLQEHKIGSADELNERTAAATEKYHQLGDSIKAAETRMAEIAVLKTHIVNYAKTHPVYDAYRKAGYSKKFLNTHREEITLHKAAKAAFDETGLKKLPKVKALNSEYSDLLTQKKAAYPDYRKAREEMQELVKAQKNIELFFAEETNGCYLYQGRDVKEDKDRCLKDQILVIAPHEALIPSDVWLKCRKKLMMNKTFQQGRKPKNTWLAGKVKCGRCGYALKATHVPNSPGYFRCTKRAENKGCPGCGKIRKTEFEEFIFNAMRKRFKNFQVRHDREEKVNPKLTAHQIELAQVEAEIEKLLDTLTGANATLLAYANKKIEELDARRQTISKAIAELSVETMSPQKEQELSYFLDHWDSIDFEDKRKAADGLIISISATSDHVQVEWKI